MPKTPNPSSLAGSVASCRSETPVVGAAVGASASSVPGFKWLDGALAVVLLLGFLPCLRMLFLLFTVGGNCIGNDYVHWIKIIDGVLSGTYNWLDYPRATFLGSHDCSMSILVELLMCSFKIWDVRLECLIGMTMLVASTFLQWRVLSGQSQSRWRLVLLAALFAINFGTSQTSILLSSMFSLRLTGLCQLGLSVALWALVRFGDSKRALGLTLMALGGIVASYSCGAALPVWCALFTAMLCQGYRRMTDLLIFAGSCSIGLLPYFFYILVEHRLDSPNVLGRRGVFDAIQLLDLIGRPLCNGIGNHFGKMPFAEATAALGLVLLLSMLFACYKQRINMKILGPALSLVVFSLVAATLLALVRIQIAPWYATLMKYFWIGFVSIAVTLLSRGAASSTSAGGSKSAFWVGLLSLFCWTGLYLSTNISYDDKHFYLLSRSPASESYQRNYLTAPTYGEDLLFQWGPGNQYFSKLLGSVLYKHGLLCFGRNQEWSLQGDYFLNRVSFDESSDCPRPRWIDGAVIERTRSWRDYHHLNLCLPARQQVTWTLKFPDSARFMSFHTSCIAGSHRKLGQEKGKSNLVVSIAMSEIDGQNDAHTMSILSPVRSGRDWSPIDIPIDEFAGREIKITLSCKQLRGHGSNGSDAKEGDRTDDWAVLAYPYIQFKQKAVAPSDQEIEAVRPENTDISPRFRKDLSGSLFLKGDGASAAATHFHLAVNDLPLNQFTQLYFRAKTEGTPSPSVLASFRCDKQPDYCVVVPLLIDKGDHAYTYNLKLLELPQEARLHALDLTAQGTSEPERRTIVIHDVRLLRAP